MSQITRILLKIALVFQLILFMNQYSDAAILQGNLQGKITLAFVYDYQCPHCHRMYSLVQRLIRQNPNVKLKLYPVALLNRNSLIEATAAIASTKTANAFQAFTAIAMSNKRLTKEDIRALLKRLHLNNASFFQAMHSPWVKEQLMEGWRLLKRYQTRGVPLFVLYPSQKPEKAIVLQGEQTLVTLIRGIHYARTHE